MRFNDWLKSEGLTLKQFIEDYGVNHKTASKMNNDGYKFYPKGEVLQKIIERNPEFPASKIYPKLKEHSKH